MAKFTMLPGTYAAGDSIPLINTNLRCSSIYHEDGSPIVQVKGGACACRPAQYAVNVGVTLTSIGTAPEQIEVLQDGARISGGLISIDASVAGEIDTASMPNEISVVGSSRIAVEAVTAVTITDGVVVIRRMA